MSELEPGLDLDSLSRPDRLVYETFMQFERKNRVVGAGLVLGLIALLGYSAHAHGAFRAVTYYLAFAAYVLVVFGSFAEAVLHRRLSRLAAQEDTEMEQDYEAEVQRRMRDRLSAGLRSAANAGPEKR